MYEDEDSREVTPNCVDCTYGVSIELYSGGTFLQCWLNPPIALCPGKGSWWGRFPTAKEGCKCEGFTTEPIDDTIVNCETCNNRNLRSDEVRCAIGQNARVRREHFCSKWANEQHTIKTVRQLELEQATGMDDVPF